MIHADGTVVPLTARESALLGFLAERAGQDTSRDVLLVDVWGMRATAITRAVDVAVARLRQKIEPDPAAPAHLISVQGVGYRFVPPGGGEALGTAEPPRRVSHPDAPNPLVGRTAELAAARDGLERGQIVALIGPGGSGKSRLLLELARTSPTPAEWVSFSGAARAEPAQELATAVASAVGLDLSRVGDPVGAVGAALAGRGPLLLALDGFDALTAASPALRQWSDRAPALRIAVSSRVRLRMSEREVEVGPLPLADARALLFQRTAALGVHPSEAGADELLEGLERLPLAIELAAPRARAMSFDQIRSRLTERFRLLGSSEPGRSLRGVIEQSWSLLRPHEQRVLAWCSVFAGGFTLDAAEEVLQPVLGPDLYPLDVVEALCDASLVRIVSAGDGDPRFHLYDAVRDFAAEHLPDRDAAFAAHAAYTLGRAEVLGRGIDRTGGLSAAMELEAERENLTAAFDRAAGDDPTLAARLMIAAEPLLALRWPRLLAGMASRLVDDPRLTDPELAALVTCVHADMQRMRSESPLPWYERALARLGGRVHCPGWIRARGGRLLTVGDERGAYAEALREVPEVERVAAEVGDLQLCLMLSSSIAVWKAMADDFEGAEAAFRRSLRAARDLGNARRIAVDSSNLALLLAERGALEEAESLSTEAVQLQRLWGNRRSAGVSLLTLALIQCGRGRLEQAMATTREAGRLCEQDGLARVGARADQQLAEFTWIGGAPAGPAALGFERNAARFAGVADPYGEGISYAWAAAAHAAAGAVPAARSALALALERLAPYAVERPLRQAIAQIVQAAEAGEPFPEDLRRAPSLTVRQLAGAFPPG
ncbi:MAG: winged helix-turn-helix domain-containing protein [Myxococcota bacterium]